MQHVTRLIIIARKYWYWMSLALIAMVGATVANLAGPWLIRSLFGIIEGNGGDQALAAHQVITTSLMLLAVYLPQKQKCLISQLLSKHLFALSNYYLPPTPQDSSLIISTSEGLPWSNAILNSRIFNILEPFPHSQDIAFILRNSQCVHIKAPCSMAASFSLKPLRG